MRRIALAGNPNVGKSTLFNVLTGNRQHTGNWPGKTVALAQGQYSYKGHSYSLTDLPGSYAPEGCSAEEQVAGEFLRQGQTDCLIILCDATCLERSLIYALRLLAIFPKSVVCVNLMDEARKEGLQPDLSCLERLLGVPVVGTSAASGEGIDRLCETVRNLCEGFLSPRPDGPSDCEPQEFVRQAEQIAARCLPCAGREVPRLTKRLDRILLHPVWGSAVLLVLLFVVFWLTIRGANYPSEGLQWCFDRIGALLSRGLIAIGAPALLRSALLEGVYATAARVVAVMLPPMAIFFPLFTLLEDFGYLPRVAYLMDRRFQKAGACGKQALTLCMGLGCNAAGVTGCRIIQAPRQRLIAVLTNAFVPCNGRFPALLFLIGLSVSRGSSTLGALALTGCMLLAVGMTLIASKLLSITVLKEEPASFVLELPPYRRPRVGQVILRSLRDRTLFVLGRAVAVAAPAGLLIWCLANVQVEGQSLLLWAASYLERPAALMGMRGAVLLAFVLGSPANELVLPILLMILTSANGYSLQSEAEMSAILLQKGWTWQESVCMLVFFLFHWPCTTTLLTIKKETGSKKWTALAALLPTAFGVLLCMLLRVIL